MKNLIYTLFLIAIGISCTSKVEEKKEADDFISDAANKAKAANKTLIIEFWAPECGPCIRLKRDIFNHSMTRGFIDSSFLLVQVSPADSVYKSLWKHFNLAYQCSVIFIDKNGKEVDRTVSYNSDRDLYLNFLKDVSQGSNLFGDVISNYQKDTLNIPGTYQMAGKLFLRYQLEDAIKLYNRIIVLDPDDKFGFNPECSYKIAESELTLTGNL